MKVTYDGFTADELKCKNCAEKDARITFLTGQWNKALSDAELLQTKLFATDAALLSAEARGRVMGKHGPDYELADIHAEKRRLHSIISTKDAELEEERRMHQWTGDLLTLERSRIRQLEEAVEWAIEASLQLSRDINSGMVEQFSNALRRRTGVKE